MHGVVDYDAERHSGDHRQRQPDLTDHDTPGAEGQRRRYQVWNQAQQPYLERAQREHQDQRNQHQRHRGAEQHALDITLADVAEHNGRAGAFVMHARRQVVAQPPLRALLQLQHRPGGHVVQHDRHARSRLVDVDLVVQIEAVWQRHFIKQQILRRQLTLRGQPIPGLVVAVHAPVEALEGVGNDVDMDNLRLLAVPVGEVFDVLLKTGIADAAVLPRLQRIVDQVEPAQVLRGKIGVATKLDFLTEVFDEIVVEFVLRHEGDQQQAAKSHADQQLAAFGDDEFGEALHRAAGCRFSDALPAG